MNRSAVPGLMVLGGMVALLLGLIGALVLLGLRERRARQASPDRRPASRAWTRWQTIGFLIVCGLAVGGMEVQILWSYRRGEGSPEAMGLIALQAALLAFLVGRVVVRVVRQVRSPYYRAALQSQRGDHDGAIAVVHTEMARHSATLPVAPEPTARPDDPWAPPGTTDNPTQRRALADGWSTLGMIEGQRHDWAAAIAHYELAEQTDPTNGALYRGYRANALTELGRPTEALPLLDQLLAALPATATWYRSFFLNCQAEALIATGRAAEARVILDQSERLGRRTLVFSRTARQQWRATIDMLRNRIAAQAGSTGDEPAPVTEPHDAGQRP